MTDAREIINAACHDANQYRDRTYASAVIQSLTASGFRILGPDEIDGSTVEKCAIRAKECFNDPQAEADPEYVSTAIRALKT